MERAIVEKRHEGRFNEWEGPARYVWAVVRIDLPDYPAGIIVARATTEGAACELAAAINSAATLEDAANITRYWHDTKGRLPR
jgi:hypothetical protein